ncbi:MAG: isoaspartyl peptidase/L-asparaginase [Acidobacteriales bacterium]|nr:isoaspartyl peptidase/L-asparaginase [Terriglobales bacterium]
MATRPLLVVHGGAWNIPEDMVAAHERGVRAAVERGWSVLTKGCSAVDAVEESVVILEEDETFDAGLGSFLTSASTVQMDALIMDGGTLRAGGVGGVERVRNAVRLSRLILDKSPHVYFVGEGAEQFAAEHGMELIDNKELVIPREVERLRGFKARLASGHADDTFAGPQISHDTVGAVAVDGKGNIAAATSTGGTLNKTPGRVGDSSLIGCGCYADNQSAAVSCTGWGEPIMKLVLAKWAADRVQAGHDPQASANSAIQMLQRRLSGHGGMIVVDTLGRYGIAHNTPRMAWGVADGSGVKVGIKR